MSSNGMLGIEVRHLVALDAIAAHGSFSAAALALGYTQSAVSQQIATLERRLGVRLIERGGGSHRVEPTEEGRLVLRHAREIVGRLEAVRSDLCALRESRRGIVRVGTLQSVSARIVPEVVVRVGMTHPEVDVQFVESSAAEGLEDGVARGDLDMAFSLLPLPDGTALEAEELLEDAYVFVAAAGAAAPGDAAVHLDDLPLGALIGYRECRGQAYLEEHLHRAAPRAAVVARTDDNGLMQGLVAAGRGHALMPLLAFDPNDARVVGRRVAGVPPRIIGVVTAAGRERTPAMEAVLGAARAVCAGLVAA